MVEYTYQLREPRPNSHTFSTMTEARRSAIKYLVKRGEYGEYELAIFKKISGRIPRGGTHSVIVGYLKFQYFGWSTYIEYIPVKYIGEIGHRDNSHKVKLNTSGRII